MKDLKLDMERLSQENLKLNEEIAEQREYQNIVDKLAETVSNRKSNLASRLELKAANSCGLSQEIL